MVEIDPEEDFLIFVNDFSLFRNYLLLEKSETLHFYKLRSPSPKYALCQVLIKIGLLVLEKKNDENVKSLRTDG